MDEDARNWVFKANSCMQEAMNTAGHIKSISDFKGFCSTIRIDRNTSQILSALDAAGETLVIRVGYI